MYYLSSTLNQWLIDVSIFIKYLVVFSKSIHKFQKLFREHPALRYAPLLSSVRTIAEISSKMAYVSLRLVSPTVNYMLLI